MFEDVKNYFANFDGATNACRTVALWVTVAVLVAFAATRVYIAVLARKSEKYTAEDIAKATAVINGAWIASALVVATGIIVTFVACYFVEVANGEDFVPILFFPLIVLAVSAIACAIVIAVKPTKTVKIVCASVCGAALIAAIVCISVHYASGDAGKVFGDDEVPGNVGLYLSALILAAGVIAAAVLVDRKSGAFDTRAVAFASVCIALSFALSYVRIFKMPMGGSITLASMLPLMLFSFMFGCRKGLLAGVVYGMLQAVQDPWIVHPAQFVLDYGVAFAGIGLTGMIRDLGLFKGNMRAQFALGAVIACAVRFVAHYFAGVFAFGMSGAYYAGEYGIPLLANAYFYSFVYQCLYIVPELIIVLVVGCIVLSSKNMRTQVERYSAVGR